MKQSNHPLTRKQTLRCAAIAASGGLAILLGLALIILAHYHERAYIFLGLGTGGLIGGIAGIVVAGSKVKVVLGYGMIAMGMMGLIVGLNYLANRYGSSPNEGRGYFVIASSILIILIGIAGGLTAQSRYSGAAISSVIGLGMIASLGIVALATGTIYLVVLQSDSHALLLLGAGLVCLLCGITCGIFFQSRARFTSS